MSDNLKEYQDFASWLASAVLEEDNKYMMADNVKKSHSKP